MFTKAAVRDAKLTDAFSGLISKPRFLLLLMALEEPCSMAPAVFAGASLGKDLETY